MASQRRFFQQFITNISKRPRTKLALQLSASAAVASMPIMYWSHSARKERSERGHEVATRIRIPSVQTIDDLMVEKCQPGDVVLFDRRSECCAAGFSAALGCLLGKTILCDEEDGTRSVERGSYEHCGVVVPGLSDAPGAQHDPSNLCLLEATSGNGIVCRPLLTRLEMSRSRSVMLLPLSCPGEQRQQDVITSLDDESELSEKTKFLKKTMNDELIKFRDKWLADSQSQGYENQHSYLSIMGAFLYLTNLYPTFPIPVSPSAWLVVSALQECGAAMKLNEKQAQQTRVEDFTRDGRFFEKNSVRLRPGWKFLSPVAMRETSVS
mmetsp:Transcript_3105/g.4781  ORF Transcript_3105/g.4781 Transcript_3105/m.4781 type:complete len:324 (-) Transcript_3105:108-1079(-)|eukprot:CAMPEP_0201729518 /NCGR_PEP_ID=MMETSP0593-20130828/19349_1 /ASSEMBLY_ACC=CAM_ASM_000672 /TAXON_ID=267983 /ORGANISM="Skeletonema japonicum, Strain CCMP2506" /LENGTH=323 /DNA_ID=CAMNT_0048221875 /DNA_START=142 /DNA_END=1113 /DNA_ORIENTATION=-